MNRIIYPRQKKLIIRDKHFEIALHRSHQALRQVVQTVPVAVCIIDRHKRIYLDANEIFCETVGVSRKQILLHRDEDLPAGLGVNNLTRILNQLEGGKPVSSLELLVFNQSGKLVKGSAHAEWMEYAGQECVLVTFVRDAREDTRPRPSAHESKLAAAGEVGRILAEMLDLGEIYRRLASSIYQLLPDVCTIYISLYDQTRKRITCAYAEHEGEALDITQVPELSQENHSGSRQFEVVRSGKPAVFDDLQEQLQPGTARLRFIRPGKPARSGVYVPMFAKGQIIGLVQALSYRPARFQITDTALLSLVANTAAIAIQNARLAQNLEKTNLDLNQTYEATIDGWTRALELRDFTTERHTHRVVNLTLELAKKLGMETNELVRVRRGAQLHDIGKMGIPDNILLKPGPLDESEWRVMRRHPIYAYELLRPIPRFSEIIEIPYCHHEKWDGSGYPRRLRGEEIPVSARIFSIVDVWDALSSNRPYRAAWPPNQVVDYIRYQSNKHFEPEVTRAFLELVHGDGRPKASPTTPLQYPPQGSYTRLR